MISIKNIEWAIRRLTVPVDKNALVLEVGSGGNPYPRANVLVDAYEETQERHWDPLVCDRPTVLADGERLPFKDKAFDFVIAAHVLEHSAEPEKFLTELQRVAHSGYIETPDAFMERINPYKDHRLEVTVRNNALVIRKKSRWIVDGELVELYEQRAKRRVTRNLIPTYPKDFHMQYYWTDKINYRVLNPEVDASWHPEINQRLTEVASLASIKLNLRQRVLTSMRWLFSQNARNHKLDILQLLRCSSCGASQFSAGAGEVVCGKCVAHYRYRNGVLVMKEVRQG